MPVTSVTGNTGFTLLELLVVLAILVLLAAAWPFAAPRLFPAQQLRNESQHLMATLRTARMAARLNGVPQMVELTEGGRSYKYGVETRELKRGVMVRLREPGDAPASSPLTFYPDGSSSGGILDLLLHDRAMSVMVGRVTGRASLLE